MQELSKQFISTGVFTYKDTNNSQIQLADIPFTEYKFVLDNDLSYIFNICKKLIRRSQLHLTDFIAVCEYPDDIEFDELFEDKDYEVDLSDDSKSNFSKQQPSLRTTLFTLKQLFNKSEETISNLKPIRLFSNESGQIQENKFEGSLSWPRIIASILGKAFQQSKNEFRDFRNSRLLNYEDKGVKIPISDIIVYRSKISQENEYEYLNIGGNQYYLNSEYFDSVIIDMSVLICDACQLSVENIIVECENSDSKQNERDTNDCENNSIDNNIENENFDDTDELVPDEVNTANDDADDNDEAYEDSNDDTYENDDVEDDDNNDEAYGDVDDNHEAYEDVKNEECKETLDDKTDDSSPANNLLKYILKGVEEQFKQEEFIKSELGNTPYVTLNEFEDFTKVTGSKSVAGYCEKFKFSSNRHWSHIYIDFFNYLRDNYPEKFNQTSIMNQLDNILLPIRVFDYRTGMVGYQSARHINNTSFCVITQRSAMDICSNMAKVIKAFGLDGNKFIIAYEARNSNQYQINFSSASQDSLTESKYNNQSTQTVRIRRKPTDDSQVRLDLFNNLFNTDDLFGDETPSKQTDKEIPPQEISSNKEYISPSIDTTETSQLLQLARQTKNWNAFAILYLIQYGPQTQRQLLDAFSKDLDAESENRCRAILYWWSSKFDWFIKSGDKYNYLFSIPNAASCLSNWYVKKIIDKITAGKNDKTNPMNISFYNSKSQNSTYTDPNTPLTDPPLLEPNDDEEGRIIDIIRDYFAEGYGGGPKQQYRFAQRFEERYSRNCRLEGDALDATIARLTWQIDEKGYRPETILSDENDDRLLDEIGTMFNHGAPFIEYQALLDCQDENGDSYLLPIKTTEDLCTYLRYIHADYTYFPQKFAENKTPTSLDIAEAIAEFALNRGTWVSLDELREEFPYLSRNTIAQHIDNNVMIENTKDNAWIHIDNIGLDESDYETLGERIADGLQESAPLNYQLLFEHLPDYITECLQNMPKDVMLQLLTKKYGEQYAFKAVINYAGESSSMDAALENEFGHQERINMNDILDLMKRTGTLAYSTVFTYIYSNFCRINESDFVKAESISFDVNDIDRQIATQQKGDYILMRDIVFDDFPYAGYQWNKYLLYSYIYRFSKHYELKNFANFPIKEGEGGIAILKGIRKKYDDIILEYLIDLDPFPKNEDEALEMLAEVGLIKRKNKRASEIYQTAKKRRETML